MCLMSLSFLNSDDWKWLGCGPTHVSDISSLWPVDCTSQSELWESSSWMDVLCVSCGPGSEWSRNSSSNCFLNKVEKKNYCLSTPSFSLACSNLIAAQISAIFRRVCFCLFMYLLLRTRGSPDVHMYSEPRCSHQHCLDEPCPLLVAWGTGVARDVLVDRTSSSSAGCQVQLSGNPRGNEGENTEIVKLGLSFSVMPSASRASNSPCDFCLAATQEQGGV